MKIVDEKKYYKIGKIINPIGFKFRNLKPVADICEVVVPARIDTFLCNHHFFALPPRLQVYPVCSINFVIEQFTSASVEITEDEEIKIVNSDRKDIILHTAIILKKILNFSNGLKITANNLHNIRHEGFGSSAALQSAVALAINKLYSDKIPKYDLIRFLAQNYGEESSKHGYLSPMASIGGAAASASIKNSNLIIIGGESEIWKTYKLSKDYRVVIIVPKIKMPNGNKDMKMYNNGFNFFKNIGWEWGYIKEDLLKNKIIRDLSNNNPETMFKLINMYTIGAYGDIPQYFKHRWLTYHIFLDRNIHKIYSLLFSKISTYENCFFVSSGGPSIAIITNKAEKVKKMMSIFNDFKITVFDLYDAGPVFNLKNQKNKKSQS